MKLEIKKGQSIIELLNYYHLSKKKIYDLKINNKIKGDFIDFETKLEKDEILDFDMDEDLNYTPEEGNLNIIYEDEDFLIVSKEAGMIIHDEHNSLANIVAYYYQKKGLKRAVRFPSRIDMDTTGIMLFAKHILASSYIDYLFKEQMVKKEYLALVYNPFIKFNEQISYKIGRDRHINGKMVVSNSGKEALTYYTVLKNGRVSLVKVIIKTGRTHQIRVHFSKINHPLLGDNLYGKSEYKRVMLHANSVEFFHPRTKKILKINAQINEDMQTIIDKFFND